MGNCTVKGDTVGCSLRGTGVNCSTHRAAVVAPRRGAAHVQVMTVSGGIVEFDGPIRAGDVLAGFPRHGIFRQGHVSSPLLPQEQLQCGQVYRLLPLGRKRAASSTQAAPPRCPAAAEADPSPSSGTGPPELVRNLEVLPPPMKGVWRIKMVIGAEQLAGILSEQVDTEALIERMRMLASREEAAPMQPRKGAGGVPSLSFRSTPF